MYYCICYYLAELLAVRPYNMSIGEPIKTIYRFLAVFLPEKKYFWPSGAPCSAWALGPGLAGLCLKTALQMEVKVFRYYIAPVYGLEPAGGYPSSPLAYLNGNHTI